MTEILTNLDAEKEGIAKHDEKPLIEHIRELRRRLIISLIVLAITTIISYLYVEDIYAFLVRPLSKAMGDEEGRKMIFTSLPEAFFTYLRLALFSGIILSFPVIAWQIYAFSAPGLYATEKKFFIPFLVIAPALFLIGASFVYYFLFPTAWKFFLSFEMPGTGGDMPIKLEARVSEYLSLVTSLILAFGITFQMPLVIVLLAKVGIITATQLRKFRKFAVVLILTVAAFITPPDVFSQLALAVPLYFLYEISIIFSSRFEKISPLTGLEPAPIISEV